MSKMRAIFVVFAGALSVVATDVRAQTVASSEQQASLGVHPIIQDYVVKSAPAASPAVPPTDPVKLAAFQMMETHCARCHETDRLVHRAKPAKGFGNILHLDEVAANPKYVKPGDPDRSLLFHVIVRQEMPSDVFSDGDMSQPTPTKQDLQVLRDWIVGLDKPASPEAVASAAAPQTMDWQALRTSAVPRAPDQKIVASLPSEIPVTVPQAVSGAPAAQVSPLQVASLPHAEEAIPLSPTAFDRTANLGTAQSSASSSEMVVRAQERLSKLGCFEGEINGIRDSKTDAALSRYNVKRGRGPVVASLSTELLDEMLDQPGRLCTPDAAPRKAERSRETEEDGARDEAPRHRRPKAVAPPHEVAHASEPAPRAHNRPHPAPSVAVAPKAAPQPKVAHTERRLRQPTFRAAQRPASRDSGQSTASSTVSSVNGI